MAHQSLIPRAAVSKLCTEVPWALLQTHGDMMEAQRHLLDMEGNGIICQALSGELLLSHLDLTT